MVPVRRTFLIEVDEGLALWKKKSGNDEVARQVAQRKP
jgi:hypothetical protein